MRLLPYIAAVVLGVSFVALKVYKETKMGRSVYAPLSDLKTLLNTPIVGTIEDSYSYLLSAYGYYKNFVPVIDWERDRYFVSFRFLSSIVFVPFMWIFKGYFPIAYILFFSLAVMLSYAHLLQTLKIHPIISTITLVALSPLTFYHIPRLMLEPPAVLFLIWFLISFLKRRYILSFVFLFIAGIIRAEISVLCLIFGIYAFAKTRKLSFSLSVIPVILQVSINYFLGDQSNFYFWTYRGYLENFKYNEYSSDNVKACINKKLGFVPEKPMIYTHPYLRVSTECWKEVVSSEMDFKKGFGYAFKQILKNAFDVVFFPVSKFSSFFKWPILSFYLFYGILVFISVFGFWFWGSRLLIVFYAILITIYSLYNPFGLFDSSRFKQMLIPFEVVFISSLLSIHRFQVLKPRQF
ncbi:MAG: hypothetical protein ABIL16_00545 [candidate division WOR-3 bacterium]